MDKLLFIINPIAGSGRAKKVKDLIRERMERTNKDYEILFTQSQGHAVELAKNSKSKKVIAVGGDGTVNEVAKGLIARGQGTLGVIAAGTGNDLSRSLSIPQDFDQAMDLILRGISREIDIGKVNGNYFLNIASFGFDAQVVKTTSSIKKRIKGGLAYIIGVLISLFSFKKESVLLEIDGKSYNRKLVLLAVGSGKFYGGGLYIMPQALMDDGYLHLCLVKDVSNITILFLFPTIFKGKHIKIKKYVETYKAKKVKLTLEKDSYFNYDGELIDNGKEIVFELAEEKLSVIC